MVDTQEAVVMSIDNKWFKKGMIWTIKMIGSTKAEVGIIEKGMADDGSSDRFLMVKEKGAWKVALPPGMFGVPPFEKETNK